jgi:hypothetical protein
MASGTSYAAERQQHYDDGDRERGVERQPWNPCHSLEDYRRDQASKEQQHNYTPDDSVSLTKVFAHRFHGARFYSLWSAAQCSRQPEREARLDPLRSLMTVRFQAIQIRLVAAYLATLFMGSSRFIPQRGQFFTPLLK